MSESYVAGLTSQSITLLLTDTTGNPKTGLTSATSGLVINYSLGATGTSQPITLASQTSTGAWTSGGFCEKDATNFPGCYRLDLPNAALASSLFMVLSIICPGTILSVVQRIDCRFVATDNTTIVTAVWANTTRTLSSFGTLTTDTAAAVWANATRSLTTFGTLASDVWANGSRSLTTFGTLTTDTAASVWAAGTRTLTSLGTVVADVTTAVWAAASRTLTAFGFTVGTSDATSIAAIKAKTDNLPSDPADESLILASTAALSSQISGLPTPPTASTIATASAAAILVTPSNLLVTNSDGSVNSTGGGSGGGGDPWVTPLPGTYPSGQAGNILGNLAGVVTTTLSRMIPINGPVPPISLPLVLIAGDDYYDADGRAVGNWSFTVAATPVWTNATVALDLTINGLTQVVTTTAFTGTGTTRTIKFDVPGSVLTTLGVGKGTFSVTVTLASPSLHKLTMIDKSCLEIN